MSSYDEQLITMINLPVVIASLSLSPLKKERNWPKTTRRTRRKCGRSPIERHRETSTLVSDYRIDNQNASEQKRERVMTIRREKKCHKPSRKTLRWKEKRAFTRASTLSTKLVMQI
jgi:hypothetical protein